MSKNKRFCDCIVKIHRYNSRVCCVVATARVFWVVACCHFSHKPLWWFGPYIWLNVRLWDFFACQAKFWLYEPHLSHCFLITLKALYTDAHPNIYCKVNTFHHTSNPVIGCAHVCCCTITSSALLNELTLNSIAMHQGFNGLGFSLKRQSGRKKHLDKLKWRRLLDTKPLEIGNGLIYDGKYAKLVWSFQEVFHTGFLSLNK